MQALLVVSVNVVESSAISTEQHEFKPEKEPWMSKQNLRSTKYEEHMKALEEHRTLLDQFSRAESDVRLDELKFSLERLAFTLEEYFKVIGIP
jgi:hypothetical protein